eukprot:1629351-Rhodomonas_salina.2
MSGTDSLSGASSEAVGADEAMPRRSVSAPTRFIRVQIPDNIKSREQACQYQESRSSCGSLCLLRCVGPDADAGSSVTISLLCRVDARLAPAQCGVGITFKLRGDGSYHVKALADGGPAAISNQVSSFASDVCLTSV